eukprot:TRINITY_DN6266_c0_g2_i2.p1 TRINITY_DN6266_c0_g2~~TRINITY_DN6266_c0_g2_i2.p1  ORF type:complete len:3498 (+),score=514.91 TRINITY_DN6266_c0_g2_i2:93-10586(+)
MDFFKRLVGRTGGSHGTPKKTGTGGGETGGGATSSNNSLTNTNNSNNNPSDSSSSSGGVSVSAVGDKALMALEAAWRSFETEPASNPDRKRAFHSQAVDALLKAYDDQKIPYAVIESRLPALRNQFPATVSLRLSNALISTNSAPNGSGDTSLSHASSRALRIEEMLHHEKHLLRTLFILAQELPPDEIDPLVETGLPSCLVNLYAALMHLPPRATRPGSPSSSSAADDVLADEMVITILLQLCTIKSAVLELQQTDTLFTLFTIPLTELESARRPLRERIMPVTFAVVKYHMDVSMAAYLMKRKLVDKMISNLDRHLEQFSSGALVDLCCLLLKVLERSAQVEHEGLLLDFRSAHGYSFLTRVLVALEQRVLDSSTASNPSSLMWSPLQQLLAALSDFVYIGVRDLTPEADLAVEQLFGPSPGTSPRELRRRTLPAGDPAAAASAPIALGKPVVASASSSGINGTVLQKRRPSAPMTPRIMFSTAHETPDPSQGPLIRNIEAYQVFQEYFLQSKSEDMKQHVIEFIAGIYNANPSNFRLVQHLHSIAHFVEDLPRMRDTATRESVTRLLLFIITALNCIPFHELVALAALLQDGAALEDVALLTHLHHTMMVMIKYDPAFRVVLNKTGLLDILTLLLRRFHLFASSAGAPQRKEDEPSSLRGSDKRQSGASMRKKSRKGNQLQPLPLTATQYSVLMDMLGLLLQDCSYNVDQFKEKDAVRILYDLILVSSFARPGALRVLTQTIQDAGSEREGNDRQVAKLVEVMQTCQDLGVRKDILQAFSSVFSTNPESRRAFRDAGGCVCAVSALVQLEGSLSEVTSSSYNFSRDLLRSVFRALIGSVSGDKEGRLYLRKEVGFKPLAQMLAFTGIFDSDSHQALSIFMELATEHISADPASPSCISSGEWSERPPLGKIIFHPGALTAALVPLGATMVPALPDFLSCINDLIEWRVCNAEAVASAGLLSKLLQSYSSVFFPQTHATATNISEAVKSQLLRMMRSLLSYKISADEMQQVLGLLRLSTCKRQVIETLHNSFLRGVENSVPFLHFDLSRLGCASMTSSITGVAWPPSDGFTITCWIYLEQCPPEGSVDLVRLTVHPSPSASPSPRGPASAAGASPTSGPAAMKIRLFIDSLGVLCAHYHAADQTQDGANAEQSASNAGHTNVLRAESSHLQTKKWYHLCYVHERSRFQGIFGGVSENKLFVDGGLVACSKTSVAPILQSVTVSALWGTPTNPTILFQGPQPKPVQWRLGPSYIVEGCASQAAVLALHQLGPAYSAHFAATNLAAHVSPDVVSHPLLTSIKGLLSPANVSNVAGGYAALKELGQLAGLVGSGGTAGPLGSLVFLPGANSTSPIVLDVDIGRLLSDIGPFSADRVLMSVTAPRIMLGSVSGTPTLTPESVPPPGSFVPTTSALPSDNVSGADPSALSLSNADGPLEQALLSVAEAGLPSSARVVAVLEDDARFTSVAFDRACRESLAARGGGATFAWDCGDDSPALCLPAPLHVAFGRPDVFDAFFDVLASALSDDAAETSGRDDSDAVSLLRCLRVFLFHNPQSHSTMADCKGWETLGWLLCTRARFTEEKLQVLWGLVGTPLPLNSDAAVQESKFIDIFNRTTISSLPAMKWLLLDFNVWRHAPQTIQIAFTKHLTALITSASHREFNTVRLRRLHFLSFLLTLLRDDSFDLSVHLAIVELIETWLRDCTIVRTLAMEEEELRLVTSFLQFTLQPRVTSQPRSQFARRMARNRNEVLNVLLHLVQGPSEDTLNKNLAAFTRHIDFTWLSPFLASLDSMTAVLACKICCELFRLDKKWAARFRAAGGLKFLYETLPHHHDRYELYFALFALLLGRPMRSIVNIEVPVGSLEKHIIDGFSGLFQVFSHNEGDRLKFPCREALPIIVNVLKRSLSVICAAKLARPSKPPAKSGSTKLQKSSQNYSSEIFELEGVPVFDRALQDASPEDLARVFPQKHLFEFMKQTFTLSKHFQEAFWRDKSDAVEEIVSLLFPLGRLNLVRFGEPQISSPRKQGDPRAWEDIVSDPILIAWSEAVFDFLQYAIQIIAVQLEAGNVMYLTRPNATPSLSAAFASSVSTPRDVSLLFNLFEWAPPASASQEDLMYCTSRILADCTTLWSTNGGSWLRKDIKANNKIAASVGRVLTFAIDRCSMGLFPQDGHHVLFDFVVDFLSWAMFDETAPRIELVPFLRALNRLVLMMVRHSISCAGLRPPWDSASEGDSESSIWKNAHTYAPAKGGVTAALATLDRLIACQRVVFAAQNNDFEFIASLSRGSFFLLMCDKEELRQRAMQLWKLLLLTKPDAMERLLIFRPAKGDPIDLRQQGFYLLLQKDASAFQKWISAPSNRDQVVTVLEDSLARLSGSLDRLEQSIRSNRLSQLDGTRKARVKAAQKHRQAADALLRTTSASTALIISRVQDVDLPKFKEYRALQLEQIKWSARNWSARALRVLQDPSPWGPLALNKTFSSISKLLPVIQSLQRWCLDDTETPNRMRLRLHLNADFFDNYPFLGELEKPNDDGDMSTGATRVPTSKDSRRWWNLRRQLVEVNPQTLAYLLRLSLRFEAIESFQPKVTDDAVPEVARHAAHDSTSLSQSLPIPTPALQLLSSSAPSSYDGTPSDFSASSSPVDSSGYSPFSDGSGAEITEDSKLSADVTDESDIEASGREESVDESEDDEAPKPNSETDADPSSDTRDLDNIQVDSADENDKIRRLLEPGEEPLHMFNCSRIHGMDKIDGIFLLCKQSAYFIQYYCVNKDGDVAEVPADSTPAMKLYEQRIKQRNLLKSMFSLDASDSMLFMPPEPTLELRHDVIRWAISDIVQVSKRRYLLRSVAIELFSFDGRNSLLSFATVVERDHAVDRMMMLNPSLRKEVPLSQYTDQWTQGQLSNFDYLMKLNSRAGRSYNDLTQYPVFPWVLSDYTSDSIDLSNPSIYRDLSLPMGAIDPVRREKFMARYENLDDDVPRFHYGSHYSSSGIVLHFLLRLEPFTQHFLKLQGGRFDHPDRLFHSVSEAWLSASSLNTMDVKELVPEFYYQPEFLKNANHFELGKNQSGAVLDDVVLPPWAKGSPHIFVKRMREALESEYVSQHLHEWIDLIFGFKQTGDAAADAMNLFYYLTYEGAVDIDQIDDPLQRQGIIDQINNFGQTPSQLFKKPHPRRQTATSLFSPPLFSNYDRIVSSSFRPAGTTIGSPIGAIIWPSTGDKATILEKRKIAIKYPGSSSRVVSWGYDDCSIRLLDGDKTIHAVESPRGSAGQITCCSSDDKYVISGAIDGLVHVYTLETDGKPRLVRRPNGVLAGHRSPITAIAVSHAFSLIVSADRSGTCLMWDLNSLRFVRVLRASALEGFDPSAATIRFDIIEIKEDSGLIVTAGGTQLSMWSVNGDLLASRSTSLSQPITAFASPHGPTWVRDLSVFVTGHKDGSVRVWRLSEAEVSQTEAPLPLRLELAAKLEKQSSSYAITALSFHPSNKRLWIGDSAGCVFKYEEQVVELQRAPQ